MVKIGLQLSAQLEHVTDLTAVGEDFRWYLKLRCSNCNEETPDFVYLSLAEKQALKGGRGFASLVLRCKLCQREHSIDIVPDSLRPYTADDVPRFKTVVVFDCRGVEPTLFEPRIGWMAKGTESGTVFSELDLSQLEWADYDEKSKESVSIFELKSQFIRV